MPKQSERGFIMFTLSELWSGGEHQGSYKLLKPSTPESPKISVKGWCTNLDFQQYIYISQVCYHEAPEVPVQHECIPQAILGMDILCQAKSGMGKTAVFVLATLQQIEPVDGQVRISILVCGETIRAVWD
ncbi:hypothetical protein cypCar_00023384 [Cyprinus carpio]|nr:hypothetical protein cypCar_00023384 [Cyprinus carpio]